MTIKVEAQDKPEVLPFIIVIDNDFPDAEIVSAEFTLCDSTKAVRDSIHCDYRVGNLTMLKSELTRLFEFKKKPSNMIYFKFTKRNLHAGMDIEYTTFLAPFEINNTYTILRIYNSDVKESKQKYYFKEGQSYIFQVLTPGFMTLLPVRKKGSGSKLR